MDEQGFPGCNSVLPTEFDAVNVLNQMSSSNAPFDIEPLRGDPNMAKEACTITSDINIEDTGSRTNKRKGSLFSQVVGVVQDVKKHKGV